MFWFLWMALGAVTVLGLRVLVAKARESVAPVKTCEWCRRVSGGYEVTGHSYEECDGPKAVRREEERRHADRLFKEERRKEYAAAQAATEAEEIARQAAKMRLIQVGTITTRRTADGDVIDISGWHFDTAPGPNNGGPSTPDSRPLSWRGAPEKAHGWTLQELHTMAHGGACQCDVLRLARRVRH
ncbi:hypothetical protein ACFY2W_36230 [Streptomyces sp. NPDC001262]|uniref:hypothetical protein n=1 Tax=Streptomyces sp. NPDC001262 TaxID=3364552 RepID=UPI00369F5905